MEQIEIIKQGEVSFSASLLRTGKGLRVEVHAHPDVEDFMSTMGGGRVAEVKTMGRYWEPHHTSAASLSVYSIISGPGLMIAEDGTPFRIDRPGGPLLDTSGDGDSPPHYDTNGRALPQLNLSFLRLVGISRGGVSFYMKGGVYTNEEVRTVGSKIGLAYKRFYSTYMSPMMFNVVVSTQEVPTR